MKPSKVMLPLPEQRSLTILGSTGSIGKSTLKLLEQNRDAFRLEAITAHNSVDELVAQAKHFTPKMAVIGKAELYDELKQGLAGTGIETAAGEQAVIEAAQLPSDMVMSAIVGAAGLAPTLAAIRRGAIVALANKECLVSAGAIMTQEIKKSGATLLPVDSEHNGVFQLFDFDAPERIEKITLTASGGPFREFTSEQMKQVTPEQAVRHPNWSMGAKISVDSATMMNKGLELIEAFHLFPLKEEQIDIIVHPESIIHALVHYQDGSVLAQMGCPDMCVPIAYALAWPKRMHTNSKRLDLTQTKNLSFFAPDNARFPALALARQALKSGGNAPTILNAANEVAVQRFLRQEIGFLDIAALVEKTLARLPHHALSSLEDVLHWDAQARNTANTL